MQYLDLYNAVLAETENNDPTFIANIPVMVNNAEKRVYQAVKIPALRKSSTGVAAVGNQYLAVPSDYVQPWELAVIDASGNYTYLQPRDVSFIREAYPQASYQALPRHYAQFDNTTFILAPTPDQGYTFELHYFYFPQSIVTAGTTWLSLNFENVLLYAVLVEAAVFMKSEEDVFKYYSEQYTTNLKLLSDYASGKSLATGTYRK